MHSERRSRSSTRRRLLAVFSALLAAFASVLLVQLAGLRRMEGTLREMEEHEAQMRLALEFEDAIRDQYGHAGHLARHEANGPRDYEVARARAVRLGRELRARVDEPDAMQWLDEIEAASAKLDWTVRDEILPAVRRNDPRAAATHERAYELVSLIEAKTDHLFARLQQTSSEFRTELASLETATRRGTASLLVVAPLLVTAAALYLSRSVARPLAQLSDGAAALAAGNLDTRIEIHTPDEFGALASDFNVMTVALKRHERRLVESEKLAGIGRLAAGVAHELNNPLQVMLGYLSLHRDVSDRRLATQLAMIEDEVIRCKEIVGDLLELSRPSVTPAPVDLRALCEDVAGALRISMMPAGPRVGVDGQAVALGDRPKLRQAVFNLVKNAVEAAGASGEVRIAVRAASEGAEVAVEDTGPGIPPERRRQLFEPFFTTKPAGKGLGLAVSRAIAVAHGGGIDVCSAEPHGAVFTLRLPSASVRLHPRERMGPT